MSELKATTAAEIAGGGKMNIYELARKRIAAHEVPLPPKYERKAPPPKPKYTKPAVQLTAEQRMERKRKYNRDYYEAHRDERRAAEAKRRQANREQYRSASLQWYYEHREHCLQKNKEWRKAHMERKREQGRKFREAHPGYYSRANRLKRKEKRENGNIAA